jgi:hypothetical protein
MVVLRDGREVWLASLLEPPESTTTPATANTATIRTDLRQAEGYAQPSLRPALAVVPE